MPLNPDKYQNKYRSATARAVWHDYNVGDYFINIFAGTLIAIISINMQSLRDWFGNMALVAP